MFLFTALNITLITPRTRADSGDSTDADSNGIPDTVETWNARHVTVENSTNSAQVQSQRDVPGFQDHFEITFTPSSGLEIQFSYQNQSEGEDQNLGFTLLIDNITEYVDLNGDGVFNASTDQRVQDIKLESFNPFSYVVQPLAANEYAHIITITTSDGIFTLRATILDNFGSVNGILITPGEVKLDFEIHNFPYSAPNSSLALGLLITSSNGFESETDTYDEKQGFGQNETALAMTMNNIKGFFSWNSTAIINGNTPALVNRSALVSEGAEQERFYLCYPNGSSIVHDPKIGIEGIIKTTPPPSPFWTQLWFIATVIITVVIVTAGVLSQQQYRDYLRTRILHIDTGAHRLSMDDVLENEKRSQIITLILADPGIHFNELLRQVGISAGNLAWHLDVLETFKVIRKSRIGQYLVFFPYLDTNPVSGIDPKLQKSKTTLEILQIIGDHPGIYQNQLARRMGLSHKTIQYHLEKLAEAGLIYARKEGRQRGLYPKGWPVEEGGLDQDSGFK